MKGQGAGGGRETWHKVVFYSEKRQASNQTGNYASFLIGGQKAGVCHSDLKLFQSPILTGYEKSHPMWVRKDRSHGSVTSGQTVNTSAR